MRTTSSTSASASWSDAFDHLRAYRAAHGHLAVPARYVADDGFPLGVWVQTQRQRRRQGRLVAPRVTELDALGFVWVVRDHSAQWAVGLDALSRYVAVTGHCLVSREHCTDGGFALGEWVATQRRRQKGGRLRADRAAALEALGMQWNPRDRRSLWERGTGCLADYVATHGHSRVPVRFVANDGFRLGQWVANRRSEHTRGRLTPEQTTALEALGVTWTDLRRSRD